CEPRLMKLVALDERPQALEVVLAPRRIDHEVAGHAVPEPPRHLDAEHGLVHRGILHEAAEPLVGSRFQAEEDVEFACHRPPRLEEIGMAGDEIHTALHENPLFTDSTAHELLCQRETARWMVPEEIIGDEDVIAH